MKERVLYSSTEQKTPEIFSNYLKNLFKKEPDSLKNSAKITDIKTSDIKNILAKYFKLVGEGEPQRESFTQEGKYKGIGYDSFMRTLAGNEYLSEKHFVLLHNANLDGPNFMEFLLNEYTDLYAKYSSKA